MWRILAVLLIFAGVSAACNLRAESSVVTETPPANETPQPTLEPSPFTPPFILTPLRTTPLPNPSGAEATPEAGFCFVYTTYSGSDSANLISLRESPSTSAPQLARMPNNSEVLLVPGSAEVQADGYRWLNIYYQGSGSTRLEGWTARDSFSRGGVRDTSIATLRPTGRQAPC
jgi:hypothetical protein